MRTTMWRQPDDLRRLLDDAAAAERVADRLWADRVFIVGTGTSWHAANIAAWYLREAGLDAIPVQGADAALHGPRPRAGDALLLLSHRGTKRYTSTVVDRARADGVPTVLVSGRGVAGADLETVEPETSSAFTASHTGALLRTAQLAVALGADLGPLDIVPELVAGVLDADSASVDPPQRLLEFIGAGPNQWTAAEGALKIRETAYVASEGLAVEQFLHGPSVALGERDAVVCLNGAGPGEERLLEVAAAAEACGAHVHRITAAHPNELLSVFPLTVAVQRIALEAAEQLGTNPDSFGRDIPVRAAALEHIQL
jgi:glucosamine--fructose-6-phosphate aminotransferase (isomerizing)